MAKGALYSEPKALTGDKSEVKAEAWPRVLSEDLSPV